MTLPVTRRGMITAAGALGLSAALPFRAMAQTKARVAIIGGGFGGATAARYLKRLLPGTEITLIEPNDTYVACPFSNLVVAGLRDMDLQEFKYRGLSAEGIEVVQAYATRVDASAKTITLDDDASLSYDRLIMAPGIDLRWGALEGYDEAAAELMPHAWKAGPQTVLLQRQLEEMEDGGLVVMSAPAAPYRCPPGPYERASLIAHYLKTRKPKSKLLILDSKDKFSKMPLFQEAWSELYGDLIEWRGASGDGRVSRVDAAAMTLETDFETLNPQVANVIPPQRAGAIAERAGVADATGWCPIDATSFESTLKAGIHVIGDAAIANPMPKSAFSANLQGKVCAAQVARMLSGLEPEPTVMVNTCYSYVSTEAAVSISGAYTNEDGAFADVPGAGGLSPRQAGANVRSAEAAQAAGWYRAITAETFG